MIAELRSLCCLLFNQWIEERNGLISKSNWNMHARPEAPAHPEQCQAPAVRAFNERPVEVGGVLLAKLAKSNAWGNVLKVATTIGFAHAH